MTSVVNCPSCTRMLRVPEELLGTRVKCPTCGGVFDAEAPASPPPASGPPSRPDAPPRAGTPTPSFPLDAPIKLTLDEERPASPPSPPSPSKEDPASRPPPSEQSEDERPCPYCGERISPHAERCPHCDEELDETGDDRPWEKHGRYGVRRDWEPHRGSLILTLGILSVVSVALAWIFCWVAGLPLGIVAWVMGHRDLKKMAANVMDPEGRGLTQGGWICGIIGTILNSLAGLLCLGYLGFIGWMSYSIRNMPPAPPRPAPPPPPAPKKMQMIDAPLRLADYLPRR